MKIKDWLAEERPREKLYLKGSENLTNAELLAIIISSGTSNISALSVSNSILSKYKKLELLHTIPINSLVKEKGIGFAKACKIKASLEFAKRFNSEQLLSKVSFFSSKQVFDFCINKFSNLDESFFILFLDERNRLITYNKITQNNIFSVVFDLKNLIKNAFLFNASGVVLVHNHPSEIVKPTLTDIKTTKQIGSSLKSVGLYLMDHIVVSKKGFFSFKDEGLI